MWVLESEGGDLVLSARGLLASKMTETAAGMVDNFLGIVETHGFIPNGSRTYYENRRLVVVPFIFLFFLCQVF